MSREIELWKRVVEDETLLMRASAIDTGDVAAIASLRRDYPPQVVSSALSLCEARGKAIAKFGTHAAEIVGDVAGVEQASAREVAMYKAGRFREALGGSTLVADLCCGIGGDAMALASAGLEVVAVDRDALRVWMACRNSRQMIRGVCADVSTLALVGLPIHLDPARRSEGNGRRVWRLEDYQPGPAVMQRLIEQSPACAIKLSPGIDLQTLPWTGEVEFISERGRLVQAVLWTGDLMQATRRATRIDALGTHVMTGEPSIPGFSQPMRYLYTFDPAVERADLVELLASMLDAPAIHPRLGLLTADRLIDSPWVQAFELIEQMPWRPKRVKQWLSSNGGGLVEVKTRGKACDPDQEQHRLRCKGETVYTVFVLRFDTKVQALIAKRLREEEQDRQPR